MKKQMPKKPRNPMAQGLIIRHGSGEGVHGKTGSAKNRFDRRSNRQKLKREIEVKKNPSGTYTVVAGVTKGRWGDEPYSRYIIPAEYEVTLDEDGSISAKKTKHPFGSGYGRFDRGLPDEVKFVSAAEAVEAAVAEEELSKPSRGSFEGGFYERMGRLSTGHYAELDYHQEVSKFYEKLAYLANRFVPSLGILRPNPAYGSRPAAGMAEGYLNRTNSPWSDIRYVGEGQSRQGYGPVQLFVAKSQIPAGGFYIIEIGREQGDTMSGKAFAISELEYLARAGSKPNPQEIPEGYRVWQDVHGWWWESPGGFVGWYPEKTRGDAIREAAKDKKKSKALLPNPPNEKRAAYVIQGELRKTRVFFNGVKWVTDLEDAERYTVKAAREKAAELMLSSDAVDLIHVVFEPVYREARRQMAANREAVSNRSRLNPKDMDVYDPREEQMRAQRQAIYESQVRKALGLAYNDSFRDGSGKRLDVKLIGQAGLAAVRTLIGRSMFAMGTRVQQRTGFVMPRTQQFTPKTAEASELRYYGDPNELIQNRQDYEESLAIARKSGFYRVTPEITATGLKYTVWPMPIGQGTPITHSSPEMAQKMCDLLNQNQDPLKTCLWWKPLSGSLNQSDIKAWLPPREAFKASISLTKFAEAKPLKAKAPKPGPTPKVLPTTGIMSYSEFCRARSSGAKDPNVQRVFSMKGVELTTVDVGDILAKFELRYRKGERA